jgi:hypothetical protein
MSHNVRKSEHPACGCADVRVEADRADRNVSRIRVCYSSKLHFMGGRAGCYFKIQVTGVLLAIRKLGHTLYRCPSLQGSQAVYFT